MDIHLELLKDWTNMIVEFFLLYIFVLELTIKLILIIFVHFLKQLFGIRMLQKEQPKVLEIMVFSILEQEISLILILRFPKQKKNSKPLPPSSALSTAKSLSKQPVWRK